MTATEETRLLQIALKRIEVTQHGASKARWLLIGTWVCLVAAFVALFQLAPQYGKVIYFVAGMSCLAGVLASFSFIHAHSLKQWPVMAPHVNADSVRRRIEELKPNKSLERTRER
jgi:hypothetical protein